MYSIQWYSCYNGCRTGGEIGRPVDRQVSANSSYGVEDFVVSSLPSVTRAEIMMRSWLLLLMAARALLLLPLDSLEGRIVAR